MSGGGVAPGLGDSSGRAAATAEGATAAALLLGGGGGVEGGSPVVEVQGMVGLQGGGTVTQVLSQLHSDAALGSVLQPGGFTSDDLSGVIETAAGVTSDPESLRFQFPLEGHAHPKKKATLTVYREQDRFLPINNVSRVMRNAIPRNGKVSKDAKECMQECVSEFVSFITSEYITDNDEKRKTLTGDDILFAMANLGFDNYIQPMKLYLQKIREYMKVEKMVPGAAVQDLTPAGDGGVASSAVLTEETAGMILQHPTLPPFSSSISPPFSPPVT